MKSRYFYGYNIVAAGFLIQAVAIGAMFTYGVFFKSFQEEFGWSRAMISGASSLAFLMMGGIGMIAGALNDRIGPRIIMTVSGISLGLGYLLLSRLEAPWQLYLLYGGFVGCGFSTHDVITLTTVARWFDKRRGMMSGLVKVGTGAGQLLLPFIATALIIDYGWRDAYLIIGAASLIALVLLAQVLKRDPQGMGLFPDGSNCTNLQCATDNEDQSLSIRTVMGTAQFWIICIAEFTIFFCLLTTIIHIIPHARDLGLQPTSAAAVLSTIGGVSMLGRIVMGTANDKIGGKRSLMICLGLLISSLVLLILGSSMWVLFLFAIIYGFAHGGLFTVMSPTIAELFGTGSHGTLFGLILFSGTIGGSVGPWLTGYVFDTTGSYQIAFIILIVLATIGLGLIGYLHPLKQVRQE
ncbi:MAG: MFS transporter [Deltaproteobacteria bacterium]|nr:MFS transporter [Deltaproteobacteria bacterium]